MNGIVILNYNNWEETRQYVETIKGYRALDRIIVVDNCSTDGSYDHLKTLASEKVTVVETDENGGYNKGNNYGARLAFSEETVDKVIISNPDIEVSEAALESLFENMRNGDYGIVAPVVKNIHGGVQSNCGWNLPSYFQMLCNCCMLTYKLLKVLGRSNYFSIYDVEGDIVQVEAVSGCFFVISRSAYEKIGGFDEDTFLYGEEVLLGSAIKKIGMKAIIDKRAEVVHMDQGSKWLQYRKWVSKKKLIVSADLIYLEKNCGTGKLARIIYRCWFWLGSCFDRIIFALFLNHQ